MNRVEQIMEMLERGEYPTMDHPINAPKPDTLTPTERKMVENFKKKQRDALFKDLPVIYEDE